MESGKVKMSQPWEMLASGFPESDEVLLDLRGRPRATRPTLASARLNHLHTKGSGRWVGWGRTTPRCPGWGLRLLALGGARSSVLPPVVGWKTLGDRCSPGTQHICCRSSRNDLFLFLKLGILAFGFQSGPPCEFLTELSCWLFLVCF